MFLPEGYKEPSQSNYMKFEKGENCFRVLDSAIVGWVWWEDKQDGGRKPIRVRMNERVPSGTDCKLFWAFPVWNYRDEKVQILEITQSSIRKTIESYVRNQKWGDPKEYDLVVTKTGEGLETEYAVIAEPKEKLPEDILKAFKETPIDLEALYSGDDPFSLDRDVIDIDDIEMEDLENPLDDPEIIESREDE